MQSALSRFARPILALALILGVSGVAMANDCNPCRPRARRVWRSACARPAPAPCRAVTVVAPAPMPAPAPCTTGCPSSVVYESGTVVRTQPYGVTYVSDASTTSTSGVAYLVPTADGIIETPLPTVTVANDVDRYYATHQVVNGQVEEVDYLSAR